MVNEARPKRVTFNAEIFGGSGHASSERVKSLCGSSFDRMLPFASSTREGNDSLDSEARL